MTFAAKVFLAGKGPQTQLEARLQDFYFKKMTNIKTETPKLHDSGN